MGLGYGFCYTIYPFVRECKQEKSLSCFFRVSMRDFNHRFGTASKKSCVRMAQSVSETNRLMSNSFIMNGRKAAHEVIVDVCLIINKTNRQHTGKDRKQKTAPRGRGGVV